MGQGTTLAPQIKKESIMSITFSPSDAPRGEDKVYECQCTWDGAANPECSECGGTGEVRFKTWLYEVQMSNSNAYSFMHFFTDTPDYCGKVENLEESITKLQAARKCYPDDIGSLVVEEDVYNATRIGQLLKMCIWARENNQEVTWG
jgi:hypothetical protein